MERRSHTSFPNAESGYRPHSTEDEGVVAYTHDYWSNLNTFKEVASAILSTLLWPLLLLGINLHIH